MFQITFNNILKRFNNQLLLRHKEFIRNVATMMTGNVAGQVIALIGSTIVTRLYAPEDFGAMALITSYTVILVVVFSLQYQQAMVIERDEENAYNIFALCLIISCINFLVFSFFLLISKDQIATLINFQYNYSLLLFIPMNAFIISFFQSLTFKITRDKNFGHLAMANIGNHLNSVLFKIGFGVAIGSSAFWLVLGNLWGYFAVTIILSCILLNKQYGRLRRAISWRKLREVAIAHKEFPKYSVWNGLLDRLSKGIPIMLFAYYFSPQMVGFYGLAFLTLQRPVGLIGGSMTKVFLQKASETHAKELSLRNQWAKTTIALALIGILPFGVLLAGGKFIFAILFGQNWGTSGLYAQLLAPWMYMVLIVVPSAQMVIVKKRLKFNFYFNLSNTIAKTCIVILVCRIVAIPWVAIASLSGVSVLFNLFFIYYAYNLTKTQKKST